MKKKSEFNKMKRNTILNYEIITINFLLDILRETAKVQISLLCKNSQFNVK